MNFFKHMDVGHDDILCSQRSHITTAIAQKTARIFYNNKANSVCKSADYGDSMTEQCCLQQRAVPLYRVSTLSQHS